MLERLQELGTSALGPLLLHFCEWLHTETEKAGVTQLYFASEAEFLREAFLLAKGSETSCTTHALAFSATTAYGASPKTLALLREALQGPEYAGLTFPLLSRRLGLSMKDCQTLGLKDAFVRIPANLDEVLAQLEPKIAELNKLGQRDASTLRDYLASVLPSDKVGVVGLSFAPSAEPFFASVPLFALVSRSEHPGRACFVDGENNAVLDNLPLLRAALGSTEGSLLRFKRVEDSREPVVPVFEQLNPDGERAMVLDVLRKGVKQYLNDVAALNASAVFRAMSGQEVFAAVLQSGIYTSDVHRVIASD